MKRGQRAGWDKVTPRGLKMILQARGEPDEVERADIRRAVVEKLDQLAYRLELVQTMPDGPMKKALVDKYESLISGLEAYLAR